MIRFLLLYCFPCCMILLLGLHFHHPHLHVCFPYLPWHFSELHYSHVLFHLSFLCPMLYSMPYPYPLVWHHSLPFPYLRLPYMCRLYPHPISSPLHCVSCCLRCPSKCRLSPQELHLPFCSVHPSHYPPLKCDLCFLILVLLNLLYLFSSCYPKLYCHWGPHCLHISLPSGCPLSFPPHRMPCSYLIRLLLIHRFHFRCYPLLHSGYYLPFNSLNFLHLSLHLLSYLHYFLFLYSGYLRLNPCLMTRCLIRSLFRSPLKHFRPLFYLSHRLYNLRRYFLLLFLYMNMMFLSYRRLLLYRSYLSLPYLNS